MTVENTGGSPAPAVLPSQNSPAAPTSVDADIAAFLKEEPGAASGESSDSLSDTEGGDASDSPALAQVSDDEEANAEAQEGDETQEASKAKDSDKLDYVKLVAAVDNEDLPGLIEALGPAAEKLLTSSAHKALRLAAKDLTAKKKAAAEAEAKAHSLATKLADKYSDPIEIRKAVQSQDVKAVDLFVDYAEKTVGADWNAIMKWVAQGLAGRPARLEAKKQAEAAQQQQQTKEQRDALEATQNWVKTEVTKADAQLLTDLPDVVDLVIEEIRGGYHRGVVNPAKALPLVLKKLEAQHEAIGRILARKNKGKKASTTATPAARVNTKADQGKTRPKTLEEDIAEFKKELGVK